MPVRIPTEFQWTDSLVFRLDCDSVCFICGSLVVYYIECLFIRVCCLSSVHDTSYFDALF